MRKSLILAAALGAGIMAHPVHAEEEELYFGIHSAARQDQIIFHLNLENRGDEAAEIEFPSAQLYEITLRDNKGNLLYRYSEGKMFAQVMQNIRVPAKENISWIEKTKLAEKILPGHYHVNAELLAARNNGREMEHLKAESDLLIPEDDPAIDIKVTGKEGHYQVSGKYPSFDGRLYFVVEDGHDQLIEMTETEIKDGRFSIEVQFSQKDLPEAGVLTLVLFAEEDGIKLKEVPIVLETFS